MQLPWETDRDTRYVKKRRTTNDDATTRCRIMAFALHRDDEADGPCHTDSAIDGGAPARRRSSLLLLYPAVPPRQDKLRTSFGASLRAAELPPTAVGRRRHQHQHRPWGEATDGRGLGRGPAGGALVSAPGLSRRRRDPYVRRRCRRGTCGCPSASRRRSAG